MLTVHTAVTWEEAHRGFILHKQAVRSRQTAIWYRHYVANLVSWANSQSIPLDSFTKRHLDAFLAFRTEQGVKPTTLEHDGVAVKTFFQWCYRNDLLHRDPLVDYRVGRAPKPARFVPTADDMRNFLQAILDYYDAMDNPNMKYCSAMKRSFHRDRLYTIIMVELDSACRIGEILDFKVTDYRAKELQLHVREAKGKEPRILPVNRECAEALNHWLKVRNRIMKNVPANEDEGWLFISETGVRVTESNHVRSIKKVGGTRYIRHRVFALY